MTVFICIDDNFGMLFNNRRQSRDSAVVDKIVEMSKGGRLVISGYSEKLFEGRSVTVADDIFKEASKGDYCFVEGKNIAKYSDDISTLVLFKWNRAYPSDLRLTINTDKWTLKETFDFEGSSHDKITCEVWEK